MTAETLQAPIDAIVASQTRAPEELGWAGEERNLLQAAFAKLLELEQDWDTYGASTIDERALRRAWLIAEQLLTLPLAAPRVVPTPGGGVQLEWVSGPVELDLEIEAGGQLGAFVFDDHQTDQQIDGELPEDHDLLNRALARLAAYR